MREKQQKLEIKEKRERKETELRNKSLMNSDSNQRGKLPNNFSKNHLWRCLGFEEQFCVVLNCIGGKGSLSYSHILHPLRASMKIKRKRERVR
jgi:hypothetical protein